MALSSGWLGIDRFIPDPFEADKSPGVINAGDFSIEERSHAEAQRRRELREVMAFDLLLPLRLCASA
jgi:hypothetical protein